MQDAPAVVLLPLAYKFGQRFEIVRLFAGSPMGAGGLFRELVGQFLCQFIEASDTFILPDEMGQRVGAFFGQIYMRYYLEIGFEVFGQVCGI